MAWADVGARGTNGNKTSATSINVPITTANTAIGNILLVAASADNLSTVDNVQSTDHTSCTDTQGHTYTKLAEWTTSPTGVAADGVTVSLWATKLTAVLVVTTDSVTVNFSAATAAHNAGLREFSVAAGQTFQKNTTAGTIGAVAFNSLTGPTIASSGLANQEHLFILVDGIEAPTADVYTGGASYTGWAGRGTNAGGADTNIEQFGRFRILTATGDSHAASNSIARDWASVGCVLDEVTPAVGSHLLALMGVGS